MRVFISYYSDEEADAKDITDHLTATFHKYNPEVFMASSWDAIAPGDDCENEIINAVNEAHLLMVLMSFDALTRPWINFEIGVACAKSTPILFLCHKGMDPDALPRPYESLQAVNLNGLTYEERQKHICDAVSGVLGLEAVECDRVPDISSYEPVESFLSVYRKWHLHPAAHINETSAGLFLVGAAGSPDPDSAKLAGLPQGETIQVRLYLWGSSEGQYITAMVSGEQVNFFEQVAVNTRIVAKIRCAAVLQEGEKSAPILIVEDFREINAMDVQDQTKVRRLTIAGYGH